MRAFLLWLHDDRTPHRGRLFTSVAAVALVGVGALVGLTVGEAGKGAVVAACLASVLGMALGIAVFHAGARARDETVAQHLARAFHSGAVPGGVPGERVRQP